MSAPSKAATLLAGGSYDAFQHWLRTKGAEDFTRMYGSTANLTMEAVLPTVNSHRVTRIMALAAFVAGVKYGLHVGHPDTREGDDWL